MYHEKFAENAIRILSPDPEVLGLAAGGSWISGELDEYSDLDLILLTREKISGDRNRMVEYASHLGKLLSSFTGEHVGEPRLLICLYADPLLHVDIKFLTVDELHDRVEDPVILLDKEGLLGDVIKNSRPSFPQPDLQWIEDRFWTWVHYALLKIGRGEYLEALDFLGFLRMTVLGPLLHLRNGNLPRGVRKIEWMHDPGKREILSTVAAYNKDSLLESLGNAVNLYRNLRNENGKAMRNITAEEKVMEYFTQIKEK